MNRITINSNTASLSAQRQLASASRSVQASFQRLSSGLRINRASDDAAGLAISESLNADARVYAQGIRNLNEGISSLSVASGMLTTLSDIVIRLRELATQASNGTLSNVQRKSLDLEAQQLRSEYNRITASTEFSGTRLYHSGPTTLTLQGGYGANESVSLTTGEYLARNVGNGTFAAATSSTIGDRPISITAGDFNGDGYLDIATASHGLGEASVILGNGDGTYKAPLAYDAGTSVIDISSGDFNNDGILDLVLNKRTPLGISVLIGNGNGTFRAEVSYAGGNEGRGTAIGDLNNDGALDIITTNTADGTASIYLGYGDGSFKSQQIVAIPGGVSGAQPQEPGLADLDGDGNLDLIAPTGVSSISVMYGQGNGTFGTTLSISATNQPNAIAVADFNNDGIMDFASQQSIYLGNGNRTFGRIDYGGTTTLVTAGDINGDGIVDLLRGGDSDGLVITYIGNGNGTFAPAATVNLGTVTHGILLGDVNGDGVDDIITADYNNDRAVFLIAGTQKRSTLETFSLRTRNDALDAINTFKQALTRINNEQAAVGAYESRINAFINTLQVRRENYLNAASQIRDVDVAKEAAELVRLNILQQAGTAILAQANKEPELALVLLGAIKG